VGTIRRTLDQELQETIVCLFDSKGRPVGPPRFDGTKKRQPKNKAPKDASKTTHAKGEFAGRKK
jgi:hypothetical protein